MLRATVSLLVAASIAAVVFLVPASAMTTPKLVGTVGPGYTIVLKKGTTKVKTLKAGKYTFVVADKSPIHNFTLEREKPTKPHLEKVITATVFTGTKTLVWTLKPGSWRAYCSNHEAQIHLDFKVIS